MSSTVIEELSSIHLDIVVDACRRHQQARVEMLLPGAVSDAEYNNMLDERLVSVMLALANSYTAEGSDDKARRVYTDLIRLKKTIKSYECLDLVRFEQLALQHLSVRILDQSKSSSTWTSTIAQVKSLIVRMMVEFGRVYSLR